MTDAPLPEADRLPGVPHPREAPALIGHAAAEAAFLDAHATGRLHHAWLITGPRGTGKATLAWRIARFLLAEPPEDDGGLFGDTPPAPASLDIDPEHPIARRVAALSEPRLMLLRPQWDEKAKRLRSEITVEDTRKLNAFFGLSAADGGRRVVIVDAADQMNVNAANALLKLLEEPPARATLLLVCHRPARLLPTIRSRCRELRLTELAPGDIARVLDQTGIATDAPPEILAELAGGAPGTAIQLTTEDGPALYARLLTLFADAPLMDRPAAIKLAEDAAQRGREARRDLILRLIDLYLARLARTGAGAPPNAEAAPGEAAHLARLSPDPRAARQWAALQQTLADRAQHGLAVNLDPSSLILDMVLKINETAAAITARH
ncbi:DNA polymerase III subunit delta' [Ovoidimarina sediminis]|uniref:DNA polymerase III subunit delta' n=1 Tax=Ovoidimarina sediminis TaxID=3079856 RepID=UPI002910A5EF|nr:DNA polymerase III subunit delta' [Rhodophyticola sp. MJ-SS7]MDU8946186.1 DNA polymerase III subunit delta' [Rhodophyticola sp. MJ-SS7]